MFLCITHHWLHSALHCFPQYALCAWTKVYDGDGANTSLLQEENDLIGISLNSHQFDVLDLHITMIVVAFRVYSPKCIAAIFHYDAQR